MADSGDGGARLGATENFRSNEDVDFVHDMLIEEGSQQCRASFKKHVSKAATAQFCEYCARRDVSGGVDGEDFGAQIPQMLTCALTAAV